VSAIPEYSQEERRLVEALLAARYGEAVETELAEAELVLALGDVAPTACPTLYWERRGAAFVVAKTGPARWRTLFFYPGDGDDEQYGPGRTDYDDLRECVLDVLRAQADHEKERQGVHSGATGAMLRGYARRGGVEEEDEP